MVDPAYEALAYAGSGRTLTASSNLDQLFSQYMDPIYRFIYRQVGNKQDAEDLTSEVFLSASRNVDSSRPEKAIARWLFTVSRTAIADYWRRYYRIPPVVQIDDIQIADLAQGRPPHGANTETETLVQTVLDSLPDRYRAVLELRFLRGYTLRDTAVELGLTVDNVKVIQHRALAKAVQIADEAS